MKKIILSLAVIGMFVGYVVSQSNDDEAAHVVNPIALISRSPLPSSQPTNLPTLIASGPSPIPTATQIPTPTTKGAYRDGQYTGSVADAFYGNIQVEAFITGGKITDVQFLQHPQDRDTSIEINNQAMPYLKQEAIAAQSFKVNIVSGATDSSYAFIKSLQSALDQAQ